MHQPAHNKLQMEGRSGRRPLLIQQSQTKKGVHGHIGHPFWGPHRTSSCGSGTVPDREDNPEPAEPRGKGKQKEVELLD
jgi:hypothetical protein